MAPSNIKILGLNDIENAKVEIYNTKGYDGKYSLKDIEQIQK